MIKNILFDFGAVLVDWNPHHFYDKHFGSAEKTDWFLKNICTEEWNTKQDGGRDLEDGISELTAIHPEWSYEIRAFYDKFLTMMGGKIPGMEEFVFELKERGFHVYGLSNWADKTFAQVEHTYPVFDMMEDKVISGRVKMLKPHRDIFEYALKRFGIKAEESVFIDDREVNVNGARACGLHGIVFKNPEQLKVDLARLIEEQKQR